VTDMPGGTVTFLFTDIEGSTALLTELGAAYRVVLEDHDRLLRATFEAHGGREVDNPGDGFFVAFGSAREAVAAAIDIQRALAAHVWPAGRPVKVRIGVHTGEAQLTGGGYVGLDVHRAARIGAAAHGGQIVTSEETRALVETMLPSGTSFTDLGYHRFKGLTAEEHLHQLTVQGLPDRFPPPRSLSGTAHLPALPTGFVGRAQELADIEVMLGRDDVRLLTLTGPGGSGKTRLALEVAARTAARFGGGTWFVPLATVRDAGSVIPRIAEVLELSDAGGPRALEVLAAHVRERHALLLLDNFEQVHAAGPSVAELLAAAPRLHVLVTSRSPLHVYGEHEFPVWPMALPEAAADPARIAESEAVQLFLARARAVVPSFALTAENAPAVADVVARVDGLPLAIELAASRVRLMSVDELAARLGNRLEVLTSGPSDRPDRQRTLRATIDWSYELLDETGRAIFRRLSCFVGGCTLDAATSVVAPEEEASLDVLEGLASLVDESLLWPQRGRGGVTRFRMLETLREYAREQLDADVDEATTSRRRHARYHLAWAERTREVLDAGDPSVLADFDEEHADVLAALEWLAGSDEPDAVELSLRLVTAMGWYWFTRGHTHVATTWLERVLDRSADAPVELLPKPLYWLGAVLDQQGELERARAAMEASVEALRTVGNVSKLGVALNGLGVVASDQGDDAAARAAFEESIACGRQVGDDTIIAGPVSGLATLEQRQGNLEKAEQHLVEALRLSGATEDPWSVPVLTMQLAWIRFARGRVAEAASMATEAARGLHAWGDESWLATCLELLAAMAASTQPRRAAWLFGAAGALRASSGALLPERDRGDIERHLAAARGALGPDFELRVAAGAAAPLDEVIDDVTRAAVSAER
jgi:predicted ATPase/class 3 adenylate cyclase